MRVAQVPVGSRLVDSLPYSQAGTSAQAHALREAAVDGLVGYLGVITAPRLANLINAGLGFMPVTLAGAYDGSKAVAQCMNLGLPSGITVWLDVEGQAAWDTPAAELSAKINAWADAVARGGYQPGLYVGAPQPLTGKELYNLKVVRYWLGIGRCIGKDGLDAYPSCGWCMRQDWHGQKLGLVWRDTGVLVDTNSVQCDHRGRLPSWVVAPPPLESEELDAA